MNIEHPFIFPFLTTQLNNEFSVSWWYFMQNVFRKKNPGCDLKKALESNSFHYAKPVWILLFRNFDWWHKRSPPLVVVFASVPQICSGNQVWKNQSSTPWLIVAANWKVLLSPLMNCCASIERFVVCRLSRVSVVKRH